jgi:hypothetical protein
MASVQETAHCFIRFAEFKSFVTNWRHWKRRRNCSCFPTGRALHHLSREVRHALNARLPNRRTGINWPIAWPQRCADFTPLDFLHVGMCEKQRLRGKIRDLRRLRERIYSAVFTIILDLLMLVFWVGASCGLAGRYQRFEGTYCLNLQPCKDKGFKSATSTSSHTLLESSKSLTWVVDESSDKSS